MEQSWELMTAWTNTLIHTPALYIVGERDSIIHLPGIQDLISHLKAFLPKLHHTLLLPECGHWTQQERPAEVNTALIEFLNQLPLLR